MDFQKGENSLSKFLVLARSQARNWTWGQFQCTTFDAECFNNTRREY